MTTRKQVEEYARIWNTGDFERIRELTHSEFAFRSAVGSDMTGHESFIAYGRSLRESLADYRCEILECVCDETQAFAKMRYRGVHTRVFLGFEPTGLPVEWIGAALFSVKKGRISDVWVLGDRYGLELLLQRNRG